MSEKVVVFTGAGISAESGLETFRDTDGLWEQYDVMQLATPDAFEADPELVLRFYNGRKETANAAEANAAHKALAKLKDKFDLVVITQNVDDLHERGGVEDVIHLHGQLHYARSTTHPDYIEHRPKDNIKLGDTCPNGGQLRPHIVWFGEMPMKTDEAVGHIQTCDKILVVGTSLSVYPAAGFVSMAPDRAEKIVVAPDLSQCPADYEWIRGTACEHVPKIVERWLEI